MKAVILTISDGCAAGARTDLSGPELSKLLTAEGWQVTDPTIVPDTREAIRKTILHLTSLKDIDLVVTTGGTGVAPRDVTPEAVRPLLEKEIPGIGELMRLRGLEKTDFAAISRSLAGCRHKTLILCLPGNPKGAVESLQAVLHLVPHIVDLLKGKTEHT